MSRYIKKTGLIIILLIAGSPGCGIGWFGGSGDVVSVEIFPYESRVPAGYSIQYQAMAILNDASRKDVTGEASWSTEDPSIALAEGYGIVKGIQPGSTHLRVTYGNATRSFKVIVSSAELMSIQVSPINPGFVSGTARKFTATGIFSDMTRHNLTAQASWKSSDPTVAEVNDTDTLKGSVIVKDSGITRIYASMKGVSGETVVTSVNTPLESIQVTPANPRGAGGFTRSFKATGIYENKTVADLTDRVSWSSSSNSTATVGNDPPLKGIALAKSGGEAVITASLDGLIGSTLFKVSDADLVSIQIHPVNVKKPAGLPERFTATGIFSNGTHQDITADVTWSVSNPDPEKPAVTISNQRGHEGKAIGIRTGTVDIKAAVTVEGLFFDKKVESSMRFTVK